MRRQPAPAPGGPEPTRAPPTVRAFQRHRGAVLTVSLFVAAAAFLVWWTNENPLPDGFQNEFLHVGNAYDLWGALLDRDVWHLRWYMYTGYWPWGFYAIPWPFLAVLGPGRLALVAGNLVHLGVLLWGAHRLGRTLQAPLAPVLLVLSPGVFGSLVRYEPNLATIAWTIAGVACLVASQGLRRRAWVVGWGACLGLGLMFDRLTVGFFLVPAIVPLLWGLDRKRLVSVAWGVGAGLLLTAAYYREFFLRHTGELLGQAPVGEIDSAGQVTATGGLFPPLYYLLGLVDSQAGLGPGFVMLVGFATALIGVGRALRRDGSGALRSDPRVPVLAAVVPALVLFTFIAKKQLFYTLPVLGPLAVLAATHRRLSVVALVFGVASFAGLGLGQPLPGLPAGPFLPQGWVAPRHTLAQPPSHEVFPFDEATALLTREKTPHAVLVMSEDQRLFEGYLALAIREGLPDAAVRGVVTDPNGTYELLAEQEAFVWVGAAGGGWPDTRAIERELLSDHYHLDDLPPVARSVVEAAESFVEVGRLAAGDDVELVVYTRRTDGRDAMR